MQASTDSTAGASQANASLRIGYLINQYPKVSHSFIRREMAGVEAAGLRVVRYAVRSCTAELVDPRDVEELAKTKILLEQGWWALVWAVISLGVRSPLGWWRALGWALRLGKDCDQGYLKHCAYFAEACLLQRWCHQDRIQHLHVHFGTNSTTVALLCHHLGGPRYSFTVHGPEEFDRAPGLALDRKIADAAFVVAISSFGRSQLYRLCPYASWPKIQLVRCGVDRQFLVADPPTIPDTHRFICVGRLCEQKGQALLVEAVHQLHQEGIPMELTLVGDGPLRTELEQLIDRLQLRNAITITGWASTDQVRHLLLTARALVLPSFAEGLPVVLMEALGLGRPVVTTYIAGIPELVTAGHNGWLVPAGSSTALAEVLKLVLQQSTEQLGQMGQLGHGAVAQRHDADREAARLATLFRQACCFDTVDTAKTVDTADISSGDRPNALPPPTPRPITHPATAASGSLSSPTDHARCP